MSDDTRTKRADRLANRWNELPDQRRHDLALLPFYARALARELLFVFDEGALDTRGEDLAAVVARVAGGAERGELRLLRKHIQLLLARGYLTRDGTVYRIPGYHQMRETLGRGGVGNRVLYFIERASDGLVKIGIANDLTERVASLRTKVGSDLRVLGFLVVRDPEVDWHARFARHHVEGEWFRPDPELLAALANLRAPR